MLAPYLIFPVLRFGLGWDIISTDFEKSLLVIVAWSTLVWLVVTWLTPPTGAEKLKSFYRKIHPGGPGWEHIRSQVPEVKADSGYGYLFVNWLLGCLLVMSFLFGFGKIIFHEYPEGIIYLFIALLAGAGIYYNLTKTGWDKLN
jgi:hypothetical protein